MSAHPSAFKRIAEQIIAARELNVNIQVINDLLDLWNDYKNLATDWDATHWGFKPDSWMIKERTLMSKRCKNKNVQVGVKRV